MAIREPERYFDQRTIRRHIKRGHVSEDDYQRFVETLPDVSENIMDKEEGGDDDGFEERMVQKAQEDDEDEGSEGEGQGEAKAEAEPAPESPAAAAAPAGDAAAPAEAGDAAPPVDKTFSP